MLVVDFEFAFLGDLALLLALQFVFDFSLFFLLREDLEEVPADAPFEQRLQVELFEQGQNQNDDHVQNVQVEVIGRLVELAEDDQKLAESAAFEEDEHDVAEVRRAARLTVRRETRTPRKRGRRAPSK